MNKRPVYRHYTMYIQPFFTLLTCTLIVWLFEKIRRLEDFRFKLVQNNHSSSDFHTRLIFTTINYLLYFSNNIKTHHTEHHAIKISCLRDQTYKCRDLLFVPRCTGSLY